ncbi:ribonuclease HII [Spiroplasma cantharicola]|uniref:Ribonuclease HII n=1 Tax=Spiroplasma cantharicola TaxID=362837 RepID=A0A0M4JJ74_9MOLU|nr:ribonuclease HII [Spiroplasma cantharicola]ALD66186.1 ribonuclease HII [Spiroplasma cantharicola]
MIENPRYLFDQKIREENKVNLISGSDEVGRGAMAGPIVVASVILKPEYNNFKIRDSKLLNEKQREELFEEIKQNCIAYSICEYDSKFVDEFNPKRTSQIGMIDTIKKLKIKPDICLIDGENIELNLCKTIKIIKGDNLSITIGAASILAKVYRDRIMNNYHLKYPQYNFIKNKGYCTIDHQNRVKEFGILDIHRFSYKPIKFLKEKKDEL